MFAPLESSWSQLSKTNSAFFERISTYYDRLRLITLRVAQPKKHLEPLVYPGLYGLIFYACLLFSSVQGRTSTMCIFVIL